MRVLGIIFSTVKERSPHVGWHDSLFFPLYVIPFQDQNTITRRCCTLRDLAQRLPTTVGRVVVQRVSQETNPVSRGASSQSKLPPLMSCFLWSQIKCSSTPFPINQAEGLPGGPFHKQTAFSQRLNERYSWVCCDFCRGTTANHVFFLNLNLIV